MLTRSRSGATRLEMPRHGAIIFGDLAEKLEVLHVACSKCDRRGQYQRGNATAAKRGWSTGRTRSRRTARRAQASVAVLDPCGAHFPDRSGSEI